MGGGSYNVSTRALRSANLGYTTKSKEELFPARQINNAMSPHGVEVRESRDSEEHPESLAIVIALDVTGSMGNVPHHLVKEGLPHIMDKIIQSGIDDPQVLFLAIGDHECDSSPLQVGQFESSDKLLDKWLTDVYLEGGGGGNDGESYALAWYFASRHTSIDCFEKRNQKGFLFTIGDEPCLKEYPANALKKILGEDQVSDKSLSDTLEEVQQCYNCFHIHIRETGRGGNARTVDGWKQLLQDNLQVADRHRDVADMISKTIIENVGVTGTKSEKEEEKEEVIL